jgi:hypothetical protein
VVPARAEVDDLSARVVVEASVGPTDLAAGAAAGSGGSVLGEQRAMGGAWFGAEGTGKGRRLGHAVA